MSPSWHMEEPGFKATRPQDHARPSYITRSTSWFSTQQAFFFIPWTHQAQFHSSFSPLPTHTHTKISEFFKNDFHLSSQMVSFWRSRSMFPAWFFLPNHLVPPWTYYWRCLGDGWAEHPPVTFCLQSLGLGWRIGSFLRAPSCFLSYNHAHVSETTLQLPVGFWISSKMSLTGAFPGHPISSVIPGCSLSRSLSLFSFLYKCIVLHQRCCINQSAKPPLFELLVPVYMWDTQVHQLVLLCLVNLSLYLLHSIIWESVMGRRKVFSCLMVCPDCFFLFLPPLGVYLTSFWLSRVVPLTVSPINLRGWDLQPRDNGGGLLISDNLGFLVQFFRIMPFLWNAMLFIFIFWPCLQYVELPWPAIEPVPQQWQHQIPNPLSHQGTPNNLVVRREFLACQ